MRQTKEERTSSKLKARTLQFLSILGVTPVLFSELRAGKLIKKLSGHVGIFRIAGIADDEDRPVSTGASFGFEKSDQFKDATVKLPIIHQEYTAETFQAAVSDLIEHGVLTDFRSALIAIRKTAKIEQTNQYRYWLTAEQEPKQLRNFRERLESKGLPSEVIADMLMEFRSATRRQK